MKKITIAAITFFFCATIVPLAMAGMARENPVHKKRKEVQSSKMKESYGLSAEELSTKKSSGKKSPEATSEKDSTDKKDAAADEKAKRMRLAELVAKYDADENGQISDEEMAAAAAAGDDKELKTLLAEKKARLEKANAKKAAGESSTGSKKKSGPKQVVIAPTEN